MTNSPLKGMSINIGQWIKSTNSGIVQEVGNATRCN